MFNSEDGILELKAKAIILAMGCRERPRGALNIPGSRCAGIFTAGTAQKYVNVEGVMPGKEVVILGSGDIGLIMARRMTLEGANVKACVELTAGKNAADCIKGIHQEGKSVEVFATDGVRYTVPSTINPKNIGNGIDVRFRTSEVHKAAYISVYFDDVREMHLKKKILTPGEMESVKLTKAIFDKYSDCKKITIKVEKE